ncbi:MAG: D-glycero-beta-D-manno-heptose 1,7-bisphosphate 7-phosphatase [Betaproteobacteria bacterium]|nr:D-glycero-beta-D-manno-heptose 1,7-bisphosphate 7-phosphatase [Betaproteobacteria bacterium]NBT11045.1 D-glycero-beta-D-manno-heptose 1,7-bisphosphate 7-phosphatase [Betaproteobacteria bacterium]NBU48918.1 D-glycero-beta-D-manno-heptose 1,7-bisphosphate 7-phosphatase [Betaproteobacteria bacterium]NBX96066.1 D-glycero-beta-D-manno-heptose 1,7-bisphosphate 7-phosphatase [Betaproteobacteria bacterium]
MALLAHHAVKLIILGRDGVLNRYREDHVKEPQEWEAIAGAPEAVARLNHAGWHAVVATNQAGIGRGLIDMASLNAVHQAMNRRLADAGGRLDAVFFCPHTPEEQCDCRKPLPGMMMQIAQRYSIELAQIPMVSDNLRDLKAAVAAGCQPHLVRTGRAAAMDDQQVAALLQQVPGARVHRDLGALAESLLRPPC